MNIFRRYKPEDDKSRGAGKTLNQFSEGTFISGDIKSNGDIRIEGQIHGHVETTAKIVLGASAKVEGNIFCENADISGRVQGRLDVKGTLFLKSTAIIEGDMKIGKLVVESGAKFNGNCSMYGKEMKHEQKGAIPIRKEAV